MTTPRTSYVYCNRRPDCEATINYHVSLELYASSVYESMASYFHNNAVGLEHLVQVFLQQSRMERERAKSLMELQYQRGGLIHLPTVLTLDPNHWKNSVTALECASDLKMSVNRSLLDLYCLALEKKDVHLSNFLRRLHQPKEMQFITELKDHVTNFHKMGALVSSLAEDFSAKMTLEDSGKH